ncbi:GNAT family N-acetyltransferase [Chishuiella changwenlii]|uniref:GNAT family N-acetyltransferase n=1 Tax=Chishuiella changwenlii TaxID=1434701 RepID=UPI002FD9F65F
MTNFRKATKEDYPFIAKTMMLAMDKIVYEFIGENNYEEAIRFLEELIQAEDNQYSYQNTVIVEYDNKPAGSTTFYDGAYLDQLRQPVLDLLKQKYNREINPENETQAGEVYIDTIAVLNEFQGKGIGSKILDYLIEEITVNQHKNLGLLVDYKNPNAQKLYENKGFVVVGEKVLMNEQHKHMQIKPHQQ